MKKQSDKTIPLFFWIFNIVILLLMPVFGLAQIIPSDDAYVRGGDNAAINYGGDPDLVIKRGTVETFFRKVLVKFDLRGTTGISAEESAVVQLFSSSVDAAYDITAYEISDDWNEESVTWNSAPASGNVLCVTDVTVANSYYEWDITDYFQTQLIASDSLISIAFFDANSNNQKITFNSKEAGSNPPLLVISGKSGMSLDLVQVQLNGKSLVEFDNQITEYQIDLPYTTGTVPIITAIPASDDVFMEIQNASSLTGDVDDRTSRIILTTPDDAQQKTFRFEFTVLPELDLFLLIGQSNMAGRSPIEDQDTLTIDHCYLSKTNNCWEPAKNPLNKYSNIRKELSIQLLGPGYTFARRLTDTMPVKNYGLIVNARGGSSISSWLKGNSNGYYEMTLKRIQAARPYGTVKAILWLQGSADQNNTGSYMGKLKKLVHDLRTDLEDENLYFVVSQLGKWRSSSEKINILFTQVPDSIHNTDYIISDGLTPINGDSTDPHFDSRSQRILGERYAKKILAAVYSIPLLIEKKTHLSVPEHIKLLQNYPNPFNSTTIFQYHLPFETDVIFSIYDVKGRLLDTLVCARQNMGTHQVRWDSDNYSSGIYLYQLKTPEFFVADKCIHLK